MAGATGRRSVAGGVLNGARTSVAWDSQSLSTWRERYSQGKVVNLDGRETHYLVQGEGRDIILIHGFFFDYTAWLETIDELARHYRVHALDLWGFGYSTRDIPGCDYPLFSQQLLAFMDQLQIDRATLVGHSLGGGIAATFAVEHPDRVDGLVLVAAAGLPNPEPLTARLFMLPGVGEFLLRLPVEALRRRMLDDFFLFNAASITPEHFRILVRSQKIRESVSVALKCMRGRFADKLQPVFERLCGMAMPKLVVWGDHDRAIPPDTGRRLHAALKGSEFVLIESAGHAPHLERAEVFNSALLAFLSRTS